MIWRQFLRKDVIPAAARRMTALGLAAVVVVSLLVDGFWISNHLELSRRTGFMWMVVPPIGIYLLVRLVKTGWYRETWLELLRTEFAEVTIKYEALFNGDRLEIRPPVDERKLTAWIVRFGGRPGPVQIQHYNRSAIQIVEVEW